MVGGWRSSSVQLVNGKLFLLQQTFRIQPSEKFYSLYKTTWIVIIIQLIIIIIFQKLSCGHSVENVRCTSRMGVVNLAVTLTRTNSLAGL